jgi:hypothetical protein
MINRPAALNGFSNGKKEKKKRHGYIFANSRASRCSDSHPIPNF